MEALLRSRKVWLRKKLSSALLVGALALGVSATADGEIITLSTNSSDATDLGLLDATFDFSVGGVGGDELTFTVTNDTSVPNTFNINEMYFNGGGNVAGLMPVSLPTGWFYTASPAAPAARYGTFDFKLDGPLDNDADVLMPGASKVFTFDILGVGSFFANDFTTKFSVIPPGDKPVLIAAKFVFGPDDPENPGAADFAFGGAVPEPGVLALLAVAGLFGGRRRRSAASGSCTGRGRG